MRSILLSILLLFCCASTLLAQANNPFELKNRSKLVSDQPQTSPSPATNDSFDVKAIDQPALTPLAAPTSVQPTPAADQTVSAAGSSDPNPFDLNRTDIAATDQAEIAALDPSKPKETTNPFDIQPQTQAEHSRPSLDDDGSGIDKSTSPIVIRKKAGKREGQQQTFLFWTILGLLFTGTLVFVLFQPFIQKSYRAFTNDNMLKLLQRENAGSITFPYLVLYAFFFVNAGIFTYLASTYFEYVRENYGGFLLKSIFGIAIFFIVKHLLLSFISAIFQISKEIEQYTFTIVVFSIILGIVLVPFNVLTAFSTSTVSQIAFYGAFVVIGILYLFRFFRSLFIASKFIALNKFHFFMYLCTIEIAPIAILIKVLMNSTGVQ